ncbi:meprin A subunit beta-like [Stegostoma tigrinum]|uniref:meprin A subunit beta-like n=1 Tax=Stegostoma tigrinum TaxID=3053191 RepID=UPI0028709E2C|nr:meprin A subunit beta-like [Stegostoma tigrinum]
MRNKSAVRQSEVKKQNNSFLLDTVQTKTVVTAEDAIVRINQRIFRYEKPWRNFLIEGDIVKPLWRNAVVSDTKTWQKSPDGVVRIPYEISQQYDEETWSSISRGFKDFEKFTCVHFVPHSDEKDFISIQPIHGCYSSVGRVGGMQVMSLNHQCLKKGKGVVEHEIMHALGFWHEHARSDRGKYIKIEWKNVWPGYEHNFLKQNTNNLETKYDYGSILHYSRTAFSKNGQPTLRPLIETDIMIGQRIRLSELDLLKINRLYNCTMHLKDKANVLKRLPLLNESGSLRELGRTKEAERLKPLLNISPETAKVRVHMPEQQVVSLRGNGSTVDQSTAIVHEYPKCILLRKCAPISRLTKSGPEVYNTSFITAFKESATEASGDQSRPVRAQVSKGEAKTFLRLPFAQSLLTNSATMDSSLHSMSPTLAQRSLGQGPALCPRTCVRCCTKEHVLHPHSQKPTDKIEPLAASLHTVKSDTQTQATVRFLADLLTTEEWSLEIDEYSQPV